MTVTTFPSLKPAILGLQAYELTPQEIELFTQYKPLGFIFFKRNLKTVEQIKKLIQQLKEVMGCEHFPILIDEEGGRVRRLPQDINPAMSKSVQSFANDDDDYDTAITHVAGYYANCAKLLAELGITVNCAPVMDSPCSLTHTVIGDRAFCKTKGFSKYGHYHTMPTQTNVISKMSEAVIDAHYQNGIIPVMKHIPGHGLAPSDSHEVLPHTGYSQHYLMQNDFKIFKDVCEALTLKNIPHPLGMTAHVLYDVIDDNHCATQSAKIIQEFIRDYIGFKGLLITDCLTMKALKGSMAQRAIDS